MPSSNRLLADLHEAHLAALAALAAAAADAAYAYDDYAAAGAAVDAADAYATYVAAGAYRRSLAAARSYPGRAPCHGEEPSWGEVARRLREDGLPVEAVPEGLRITVGG